MAECVVSYDLTVDPQAGTVTLTIIDTVTGAEMPITRSLKPLIEACFDDFIMEESGCYREYPTFVEFIAGPGAANPQATASFYRVDNRPTKVCVQNSDTGQEAIYWILNDSLGNPQWHQSEG